MKVLLTSCGIETETIRQVFLALLPKPPQEIRALFIPTAANSPDAIEVLPKCLGDLLKCGIPRENITVYDLHDAVEGELSALCDVVYLCGGSTAYLLRRIRERGFAEKLTGFTAHGGIILGVSAGSCIFANDLPDNLGLLSCSLAVHCADQTRIKPGAYPRDRQGTIRLGNRQAILVTEDRMTVIE